VVCVCVCVCVKLIFVNLLLAAMGVRQTGRWGGTEGTGLGCPGGGTGVPGRLKGNATGPRAWDQGERANYLAVEGEPCPVVPQNHGSSRSRGSVGAQAPARSANQCQREPGADEATHLAVRPLPLDREE
jgi:hypothetical protein